MSTSDNTLLIEQVHKLLEAENNRDRAKAESVLAESFTKITRSSGKEENRGKLLDSIVNPKDPNIVRDIDKNNFWLRISNDPAVVTSLITTRDRADPQAIQGRFRNIYVFEKKEQEGMERGQWRCIAWQVTKLEEPTR